MNLLLMRIKLSIVLLVIAISGRAQGIEEVMQENEKINVVFAVILIILIGFIFYLFYLDRKVKKLEDNYKKSETEN